MNGFWKSIVELIKAWFLWTVGRKSNVSDASGPGELEDKLNKKIKDQGW